MISVEEATIAAVDEENYIYKSGWIRSYMERVPVMPDGKPIPWYVYSCISFLEERLNKDMKVFEFGAGNSTLWYGERVKSVVSVEEKQPWIDRIAKEATPNIELHHKTDEDYPNFIMPYYKEFDIICVDGESRTECTLNLAGALKSNGVVVWDNSDNISREALMYLTSILGFKKIDFKGFIPICTYAGCTSIFYKNNNCLGI